MGEGNYCISIKVLLFYSITYRQLKIGRYGCKRGWFVTIVRTSRSAVRVRTLILHINFGPVDRIVFEPTKLPMSGVATFINIIVL